MPSPVTRVSPDGDALSYANGEPVSRTHGLRMVDELGHLLAFAGAHPVVATTVAASGSALTLSSPYVVPVHYVRSAGVRVALIELQLIGEGTATLSLTSSSGSIAWIDDGGIDGTTTHNADSGVLLLGGRVRAFLDVTGLPIGTLVELRITITPTFFTVYGLRKLTIVEVPLATSAPAVDATDEIGIDAAWADPSQPLIAGDVDEPRGIIRVADQLSLARTGPVKHVQSPRLDVNAIAWNTSSTTFVQLGESIRVRATRLHASGTTARCRFAVSYRTGSGVVAAEAKISDGTNTTTLSLPGSTTRAVVEGVFTLKTTGTDQEADLAFYLRVPTGATSVYAPVWSLTTNEL